ncbi:MULTISPECIES: hypothetical protein [Nocardiaceae]|uniref:Ribosomally synthesized peptide with SipW-like signal peptide n=1 Tax=Rhodococcoides corynebacterioides TaxID=53972 RepID=A0ABS2KVI4_9NOCA|nr:MULTISPECIES: hypothetical protein [Rhodococcus]MBM7415960.1 hypothetical protein [Rhodococcus corynebacterioides]MBP1114213.1 hypothetical protein [Rhodococcus sp. PvP016]
MKSKVVLGAAAVVAAAALVGGSVQATGALWSDREQITSSSVTTGFLDLAPGTRSSGSVFTFAALQKSPVAVDQSVSALLVITNSGTSPLRFRLDSAGPTVSTPGATVQVALSASVSPSCGSGPSAFPAFTASSATTTAVGAPWQALAVDATTTWCVTTVLKSVIGAPSATYQHRFSFGVQST